MERVTGDAEHEAARPTAQAAPPAHAPATTHSPPSGRLRVGRAHDAYERQADRAAEEVVRRLSSGGLPPTAVADAAAPEGGRVSRATDTQIRRALHGGEPLGGEVRRRLEAHMGADLGHVRVHQDATAHDLATGVAARAFTVGSHVFLGEGAAMDVASRRGDALMAHEAAHTLQPGTAIRRVALSSDEVLAAVTKISFIKKKLAETVQYEGGESAPRESTGPIRAHVVKVLAQYDQQLKGADTTRNEAMALSVVMDAVAKILAFNVLNDPALAPRLAAELITIYGSDLRKKLSKSDDAQATMDLAQVIVSDDPIRLYLHNELRADYAARRIRTMAFAANLTPAEMFELLRGRFEIDMAARSRTEIGKDEDKKEAYNVKSTTGEMTAEWFTSLFGDVDTATWKDNNGTQQLDYTKEAQTKLDLLLTEVNKTPKAMDAPTDRPGLSWKQAQHLDEVDAADQQRNSVKGALSVDSLVAQAIEKELKVKAEDAEEIVAKVRGGLSGLPLTLTVQGDGWFGSMKKRNDPNTDKDISDFDYSAGSSRRETTTYKDLYGKKVKGTDGEDRTIQHYGEWEKGAHDTQDRTVNYNRFRGWKDQVMTGNRGMSSEELPAFAALNPNWAAYGADTSTNKGGTVGVNSYGNVHFVLNPAKLKNRIVYTATDHGEPHTDPFLAFADFLLAGKTDSRTGLKDITTFKKVAIQVINSIVLGDQAEVTALSNQAFEVQIFGGLNMITDVLEVWYAPTVSKTAEANLKQFETTFGVPVKAIPNPPTLEIKGEGSYAMEKKAFVQKLEKAL